MLVIKLPLAILVIGLMGGLPESFWAELPGSLQQQAAWTHTLFNLLACLAVLVADKLERLALVLVPEPPLQQSDKKDRVRLDPLLLQSPALAVNAAMRELPIIVRTLGRELLTETEELLGRHADQLEVVRPLLIEAAGRLSRQTENVARMLMQEKSDMGAAILQNKRDNSAWLIRTKRSHSQLPHSAWEILDDFQQLNRRLSGVAYVYCRDEPGADEL